jgi:hypothetical protein
MVQGKKANEMSNGTNKYQQPNMAFQRNNLPDSRGGSAGKSDGKPQNGELEIPIQCQHTDFNQAMPVSSAQMLPSLVPKPKASGRFRDG